MSAEPAETRNRLRMVFGVLAMGLVLVLAIVAIDRARNSSPLEGRWELLLVELPTASLPGRGHWIEFDGDAFVGAGDCTSFEGQADFAGDNGFRVTEFSTATECSPVTDIDRAIDNHFRDLTVHKGYLTLQTSDASVQFNYEWAR